jgi:hypothetical protein
MRKIVLALLVLLLTVPAMATVEVRCAQVSDTNQVIVTYDVDDGNNFRAFGIEISVDNGASISGIDVNDADYWVFPGSIDINEAGGVNDVGSAIAEQDSNSFILEMGSLYKVGSDEDHNTVPPTSGSLCSFMVSSDCNVAIANDAARGGVVMEDIDKTFAPGYVSLIGCQVTGCFPSGHADYQAWLDAGAPSCWCYTRQCHGDVDNIADGGTKTGYWYVGNGELDLLIAAWKILEPNDGSAYPGGPGVASVTNGVCANFDHVTDGGTKTGYWQVGNSDLDILIDSWKVLEPNDGNSWPGGVGIDANCLE